MKHGLLGLYHSLPASLRSIAASMLGFYLWSLRYDERTERLVEEAIEREGWSSRRWKVWQEERLAYVLHRAATRVPHYRDYWNRRRRNGDHASWELLQNWPVLQKELVRGNPRSFVADDCDVKHMYREHTSGTSGKPLTLWNSRRTLRSWYALHEARARAWNGVSRRDRWAIMGGQLVTPFSQTRPPFWAWNSGLSQLYLSSYHLAPRNVQSYLEALRRHRIVYILGYASSMFALGKMVLESGLERPQLKVAISNAEPLFEHQRQVIEQAFGCPVRDTYGMAEVVAAGSECKSGTMHIWPEAGIIEANSWDEERQVSDCQARRFICTGLLNADMPLIRYEVGDRGSLAPLGESCDCGRTHPILRRIEGRLDDIVITPDGRHVGRLDPVFKSSLHIREAQIIQESLQRIRVRLVPAAGYSNDDERDITRGLRDRVGNIEILVETVDHIRRSANGKFRAIISELGKESSQCDDNGARSSTALSQGANKDNQKR